MTKIVGLRTEILVTLSFLLVAALLLGGLLMLRLTEQRLLGERLRHLDEVVRLVAVALAQLEEDDKSHLQRQQVLTKLSETGHCAGWWFFDHQLRLLGSFAADGREPFSAARRQQVRISGEIEHQITFPSLIKLFSDEDAGIHLAVPVPGDYRSNGVLEAYFSLDDIRYQLMDSLRLLYLYVTLYGLVLIAVGYYLLQRNIIKPVKLLIRATKDVGRGDLETRLPVSGPAELTQLALAYNDMIHALKISRAETRSHIDELEHTNHQLHQARDELIRSEKMASVGQLAAGLAHELGNPLAALIGYLELLRTRLASQDKDVVERSLVEARRIDYLVRELLNFARPADKTRVDIVDPAVELRICTDLLTHQGVFGDVRIDDLMPLHCAFVRINRQKLHQVFINLLINAVHACGSNGVIKLSAGTDDGSVWVMIDDDGCGIAASAIAHIFDPFYTTKPPGEGTGLGLTICHRIIDEAGGQLLVESALEKGSRFKVLLPLSGRE